MPEGGEPEAMEAVVPDASARHTGAGEKGAKP